MNMQYKTYACRTNGVLHRPISGANSQDSTSTQRRKEREGRKGEEMKERRASVTAGCRLRNTVRTAIHALKSLAPSFAP
ncbi:MAG: hypothetical protein ABI771_16980, partial [Betaproteobacteria bacterium]